jgi:hypothetical protein
MPGSPARMTTWPATVCPPRLRFSDEVSGRGWPAGQVETYPGSNEFVAVTLSATAETLVLMPA